MALSLQLQKVLRSHWQTRPFDRIKPLKKISVKHKLSITPSSSFLSKHKFRLSNSHAAAVRKYTHISLLTATDCDSVTEVIHYSFFLSVRVGPSQEQVGEAAQAAGGQHLMCPKARHTHTLQAGSCTGPESQQEEGPRAFTGQSRL